MDTTRYQQIKSLYLEARALERAERARFLDERCAGQQELRAEVEGLLAESETLDGFLEQPAAAGLEREPEAEPLSHPERIGAYRILKPLGFGGMGVVYLAEQDSPRRAVALKLLRMDAASPRQLERFAREAELLGRLSHPSIARVYEAGWAETETGRRPFFAMEYVEGRALHEYANEAHLDLAAKLRLVCQVAEAAHYAHERGIVHRDLKPSNVVIDARGEPKVLDFGVARPLGSDSNATQTGLLVGTLAYMSPEQAAGGGQVDARSDVYSLGVMLYELLTGRLPILTEGLALHEAVRRVREEEPIAAGSVRKELRGDLETVLDKALAKEPDRRYATAAEFAEDLRLFLDQRPIRARRPTSLYVGWKLVRRHRALAATAAALVLVLFVAQYVSLVMIERGRYGDQMKDARNFWRELAKHQSLLSEAEHLVFAGEIYIGDLNAGRAPSADELADWLGKAEPAVARLEEHCRLLEQARAWVQLPQLAEAIATKEEKEKSLAIMSDLVANLEKLSGPRGALPVLQLVYKQMQADELARGGAPEGAR